METANVFSPEHETCRLCDSAIHEVFDLGAHHVSDFLREPWTNEPRVPLKLMRCEDADCGLVQLSHTVPRDRLYRSYWYKSGIQPAMVEALKDLVHFGCSLVELHDGDWVVDIGANDGTLLSMVGNPENRRLNRVAFDPAQNLHSELHRNCEILIPDYFPAQQYDAPRARLIFSIAMFYDLPDPRAFVREIKRILHPDGVWVCQFGDLRAVLLQNAFDAICHEHLEYYTMPVVEDLLEQEGLQVVDASRNAVNGGSLRLAVSHVGRDRLRADTVARDMRRRAIRAEDQALDTPENWAAWAERLQTIKAVVRERIEESWRKGDPVDVLGASTKGNTLLQYFELGPGYAIDGRGPDIRRAVERSPAKVGRFTVGSWIPITGEQEMDRAGAMLSLVLPWHYRDALRRRYQVVLSGRKLLFPLPLPEVVEL